MQTPNTKPSDKANADPPAYLTLIVSNSAPTTAVATVRDEWAVLAGLRFALAFIVMAHHLYYSVAPNDLVHQVGRLGSLASIMAFFAISGYSMAHSLSRNPNPAQFYERRFWRIYPLYLWALVLAMAPALLFTDVFKNATPGFADHPSRLQLLQSVFFLQGVTMRELPANGVVWTLGIEAWLYAFSPLFMKARREMLHLLIALSLLGYFAHDYITCTSLMFYHDFGGLALLSFAWVYLCGFVFYRFRSSFTSPMPLVLGAVGLTCYCQSGSIEQFAPLTMAAAVLLIYYAPQIALTPVWRKRLLWLGDLSLPLYLVHIPVIDMADGFNYHNGLVIAAAALGVAAMSLYAIDIPIRRMRKRDLAGASATSPPKR